MGCKNSVRWFTIRGNVRKLTYLLSGACCGGTSRFFLAFFKFFAYLPKSLVSKELGRRDRAANLVPNRLKYFVFSYQIRLVFLMFVLAIGR